MTVRMLAAAALAAALATPASAQGSAPRHGLSGITAVMLPEISVTYHRPAPTNRYAGPHAGSTTGRLSR
ncbi:hypothetical protein ACU4GR_08330 (plasmid) [Methylobacterium oryzae CBMB20]|uniref:Uncharacterized protein n=1 Tax=Methylobacterium oryzae TaxID=334852 RepID=A0ABU7TSG4_9HYPH